MSSQQENSKWLHDRNPENLPVESLTSYQLLAKNTLWNLAGLIAPLLVAVVATPFMVKGLGVQRFGVLMLVLMLIGYFSVFDFGLGRALTKIIAEKLGSRRSEEIPKLVWTALGLMGAFGFLGAIVFGLLGPRLAHNAFKIPEAFQIEALGSLYLIAVSIPIVISTAGLGVVRIY